MITIEYQICTFFLPLLISNSQDAQIPSSLVTKLSNFGYELKKPTVQIGGTYRLTDRGENFGDFLESLGMSRSYLTYLENMEEKLTILEATNTNPNWTMILTTSKYIPDVIRI